MSDESSDLRARPLEHLFDDCLDDPDDGFERTPLASRSIASRPATVDWAGRLARDRVASAQRGATDDSGRETVIPLRRPAVLFGFARRHQSHFGRIAGVAALCLLAGILALLLDPSLPSTLLTASTPRLADDTWQVDGPLTAFHDWRVAYAGAGGRLYVVSPDGLTTLFGPSLPPVLRRTTDPVLDGGLDAAASASPDGHWVACLTHDASLVLLHLSATPPSVRFLRIPPDATAVYWSPDSTRLALARRSGAIGIVTVAGMRVSPLATGLAGAGVAELGEAAVVGWLDAGRLLVARRDLGSGTAALVAVSVATGTEQRLASIPLAGAMLPRFSLSPARKQILAFGDGGTSGVRASLTLIDATTGRTRPLLAIERTLDGPFTMAIWNGETPTLLALTHVFDPVHPADPALHTWTLDLADDSAARAHGYGTPLGWVPDGGWLIYASVIVQDSPTAPAGPDAASIFELRSWSLSPRNGRAYINPITAATQRITFLGFVRTA
jgi:hypothetical protein